MGQESRDLTQLLVDVSRGRANATEELLPLVYEELRSLAWAKMRNERSNHTLQATALVHEAYLRLVDQTRITYHSRGHFYAAAACAIRRILIDSARRKNAQKRGGDWDRVDIDPQFEGMHRLDLLALDEALDELATVDPRAAQVVELRTFGGMTIDQTADLLDIGHATVERDWITARAWLLSKLGNGTADDA